MAIQKKDVVLTNTTTSTTVDLTTAPVRILKVSVKASADTTVSLAITDAFSETIARSLRRTTPPGHTSI